MSDKDAPAETLVSGPSHTLQYSLHTTILLTQGQSILDSIPHKPLEAGLDSRPNGH
jgi:hypothetical protein